MTDDQQHASALAEHVRRVVDTFPPLTAEQRERIAALLRVPSQLAAHAGQLPVHRPRRSPIAGVPRITETDKPGAEELARVREQLAGKPKARPRGHW